MGRLALIARLAAANVRRRTGETALFAIAITVAATTLTLGLLLHGETGRPYEQTRAATRGPDIVASVFPLPDSTVTPRQTAALRRLAHAAGVTAHSGPFPVVWTTLRRSGHPLVAEVEGRDEATAVVDQPKLTSGRWVTPGGAVIERAYAQALHVGVGDSVQIGGSTFRVVGIAVTAAFNPYPQLCFDGCALTSPQLRTTEPGLIWVTRGDAEQIAGDRRSLAYFTNLRLVDPAAGLAFANEHNAPDSMSAPSSLSWQEIRGDDAKLIRNEQTVLVVAAALLSILACATIAVVVGTRLSAETRRVGLLKAVGATPGVVASVLLAEYLAVAVAASVVGVAAGRLVAPVLTTPGAGLLGTAGAPHLTAIDVGVVAAVGVALTLLATAAPALHGARTSTIRALADPAHKPRRTTSLIAVSARLPAPLLLGIRLLARRPRRTILAAVGVMVAIAGIVVIEYANSNLAIHDQSTSVLADPRAQRLGELMLAVSVLLAVLAAVTLVFIASATALDARSTLAIARAVGASAADAVLGVALAQVAPAVVGAAIAVPVGIGLFGVLSPDSHTLPPPWWELFGVVPAAAVTAFTLTLLAAMAGAREPLAATLRQATG